jgi:hypothetical protein
VCRHVVAGDGGEDGVLVVEELVDGAHRHGGVGGDAAGGQRRHALGGEDAVGGGENRLDAGAASGLLRRLPQAGGRGRLDHCPDSRACPAGHGARPLILAYSARLRL